MINVVLIVYFISKNVSCRIEVIICVLKKKILKWANHAPWAGISKIGSNQDKYRLRITSKPFKTLVRLSQSFDLGLNAYDQRRQFLSTKSLNSLTDML